MSVHQFPLDVAESGNARMAGFLLVGASEQQLRGLEEYAHGLTDRGNPAGAYIIDQVRTERAQGYRRGRAA